MVVGVSGIVCVNVLLLMGHAVVIGLQFRMELVCSKKRLAGTKLTFLCMK